MWFERLLLSRINSKKIEDEPNGRANVIDALIVSSNGLLFELSILDGSRNRQTITWLLCNVSFSKHYPRAFIF